MKKTEKERVTSVMTLLFKRLKPILTMTGKTSP